MRILCLDDEPLALKMLEAAIREAKSDAEVTAFRKQADLLEDAKQNGCDVAFLDIHMRGMNGVEVAKRLKEINPKMNIIFVTVCSESEHARAVMRLKPSGYLTKEATNAHIQDELRNLRYPVA
jgi:DNA-binding NarL/FixJ family response regulator